MVDRWDGAFSKGFKKWPRTYGGWKGSMSYAESTRWKTYRNWRRLKRNFYLSWNNFQCPLGSARSLQMLRWRHPWVSKPPGCHLGPAASRGLTNVVRSPTSGLYLSQEIPSKPYPMQQQTPSQTSLESSSDTTKPFPCGWWDVVCVFLISRKCTFALMTSFKWWYPGLSRADKKCFSKKSIRAK